MLTGNKNPMTKRVLLLPITLFCCAIFLASCRPTTKSAAPIPEPGWDVSVLRDTVAGVADLDGWARIYVRGYGLVTGLTGTGSRECPSHVLEIIRAGIRGWRPLGALHTHRRHFCRNPRLDPFGRKRRQVRAVPLHGLRGQRIGEAGSAEDRT